MDHRRANYDWTVDSPTENMDVERTCLAVLMDLRDELQKIHALLNERLPRVMKGFGFP